MHDKSNPQNKQDPMHKIRRRYKSANHSKINRQ